MSQTSERTVSDFLAALDARDGTRLAALMSDDIAYDPCDGARIVGAAEVRDALIARAAALEEKHGDILVLTAAQEGRAAAEVTLRGSYRQTLDGLPPASGQSYSIAAGLFFDTEGGRVARFSRYFDVAAFRTALQGG
jgi:steroid delta-isomerase-like uncharacterized protein